VKGEMVWSVLSNVDGGDTFLDVGSNLGLFTIFAAKFVGPEGAVFAFEPREGGTRSTDMQYSAWWSA
jgi:hypothetical protein